MQMITIGLLLALAQHPGMPAGMTHEQHLAQMQKDAELRARGEAAMGFDQDAAEHHFLLRDDGGVIEVAARSRDDAGTREAIQSHLQAIAREFAAGVFAKPTATHGEPPPGVSELQRLKGSVSYHYEATGAGGRVVIRSAQRDAVAAIHAFLRYQIREHKTGDPG